MCPNNDIFTQASVGPGNSIMFHNHNSFSRALKLVESSIDFNIRSPGAMPQQLVLLALFHVSNRGLNL